MLSTIVYRVIHLYLWYCVVRATVPLQHYTAPPHQLCDTRNIAHHVRQKRSYMDCWMALKLHIRCPTVLAKWHQNRYRNVPMWGDLVEKCRHGHHLWAKIPKARITASYSPASHENATSICFILWQSTIKQESVIAPMHARMQGRLRNAFAHATSYLQKGVELHVHYISIRGSIYRNI